MNWPTAPSATDITSEMTASEVGLIQRLQGGADNLPAIAARVLGEFYDAIMASGSDLDTAGTLPLGLHSDFIAVARWRFLVSLPKAAETLQTDVRKQACKEGLEKLRMISKQEWAVQQPGTLAVANSRFGNWNSENKLVMRTNPTPRPGTQYSPPCEQYANPAGPSDDT